MHRQVLGEDGFDLKSFSQYITGGIHCDVRELNKSPCYRILKCSFDWDQIWALPAPWISVERCWRGNYHPPKKPRKGGKVLIFTFTVGLLQKICADFLILSDCKQPYRRSLLDSSYVSITTGMAGKRFFCLSRTLYFSNDPTPPFSSVLLWRLNTVL